MTERLQFESLVRREVPVLRTSWTLADAVAALRESGLPALPAVDDDGVVAGVFGEREFIGAAFPGYVKDLPYAGFVSHRLDELLEKRATCVGETVGKHMTGEHVEVEEGCSDLQIAETFLHHRVSIVPVVDGAKRVTGVISRSDFFRALADRLLDAR